MTVKLYKTKDSRVNSDLPGSVEIYYEDGTVESEEYVIDYGFEIAIYEGDHDYSERKYTISPFDADVIKIVWIG